MTDDLSQALVSCREKVEGLHKDIERLKADNARLSADYLSRIPREHYAQMQQQIDELSRKCARLSDERDRLRALLRQALPVLALFRVESATYQAVKAALQETHVD